MSDYAIASYSPYLQYNYRYVSGGGIGLNPAVSGQQSVNWNSKPDVITFRANNQTQTEKKGLSNTEKLGIGAIATLGLGALVFALTRGKGSTTSVKQIAEHIDFKQANTIEEARQFALDKLGVKLNLDDLEVANYVNEGLVNVSNKLKGKSVMPKVVEFDSSADPIVGTGFMAWRHNGLKLRLKHKIANLAKNAKSKNISLAEYIRTSMYKDKNFLDKISPFHYIYHELGHGNHFANCSEARKMVSLKKLADSGITDTHYTEEFQKEINKPELQDLYKKIFVSNYAKTAPTEFVAEVFGSLIAGVKVPKEFMDLYKKYGGVLISA